MTKAGLAIALAIAPVAPRPVAAQTGQATAVVTAPVISDTGRLPGPRQPIFFRHDVHAGQEQIPCLYCHNTVTIASEPGIPALQTCVGCHTIVTGGKRPFVTKLSPAQDSAARAAEVTEVGKVRTAFFSKKAPEWVRIHALPGFVRFPHQRHIKILGTDSCINCHGDVRGMPQVYQVATLKMGWCINCHVQRSVSRDCSVCHY